MNAVHIGSFRSRGFSGESPHGTVPWGVDAGMMCCALVCLVFKVCLRMLVLRAAPGVPRFVCRGEAPEPSIFSVVDQGSFRPRGVF